MGLTTAALTNIDVCGHLGLQTWPRTNPSDNIDQAPAALTSVDGSDKGVWGLDLDDIRDGGHV